MWSGAIVDIPIGFQLCDGTNGTPNLRDQFVIGAGLSYAVDEVGGVSSHAHTAGNVVFAPSAAGIDCWDDVASSTESHLPPFFALAYIQHMA